MQTTICTTLSLHTMPPSYVMCSLVVSILLIGDIPLETLLGGEAAGMALLLDATYIL